MVLDNAQEIVLTIAALPIELDSGLAPGPRQLLDLAMRYSLSSYDDAFLDLALRHGIPIACQDAKLKEASL